MHMKTKKQVERETLRGKAFYTEGHGFSSTVYPFPLEFTDKVVCSDCIDVLKRIPDNSVDLILTSPPYNFDREYEEYHDVIGWQSYFNKLFAVLDECIRILKFGGRIVLNVQPVFSDYIPSHHIISHHMMEQKMIWRGEILWEKNNFNCNIYAFGSWKSPSCPYLKYTWEYLEIFSKGSIKHKGNSSCIDITGDEFKNWVMAKWNIAPETRQKSFGHPAMFPEALVERVLKLFSFQNDVVIDPFNGAGTTTLVAKRLNRRYLGIDISSVYCKTAERRIKEEEEMPCELKLWKE